MSDAHRARSGPVWVCTLGLTANLLACSGAHPSSGDAGSSQGGRKAGASAAGGSGADAGRTGGSGAGSAGASSSGTGRAGAAGASGAGVSSAAAGRASTAGAGGASAMAAGAGGSSAGGASASTAGTGAAGAAGSDSRCADCEVWRNKNVCTSEAQPIQWSCHTQSFAMELNASCTDQFTNLPRYCCATSFQPQCPPTQ